MALARLCRVAEALGHPAEAEADARRAVALTGAEAPEGHPARADALRDLGRALSAQGRIVDALPVLEQALRAAEQAHGPQSPFTAACLHNLAGARFNIGQIDQAAGLEQRAIAIYETHGAVCRPALASSLLCLARVGERQGRMAAAQELAARAQALGPPPEPGAAGTIAIVLPKQNT